MTGDWWLPIGDYPAQIIVLAKVWLDNTTGFVLMPEEGGYL